jgi:hypothetical protein
MPRHVVLKDLDANQYTRHALHGDDCTWTEKNCYADLWIELLHSLELEPLAALSFAIAIDFEGDQWTFFKPVHDELHELYGVDIQELTVWRPLVDHAVEHLSAGKLISTEADAFWLPDTAGTDYRSKHTKTTIVLNDLDIENQRLGYFHNAGYYQLHGEDFIKTFRLDAAADPTFLPLFAEFVRIDKVVQRPAQELATRSWQLLAKHLQRAPSTNPMQRFRERFATELTELQTQGLAFYHAWAFAATRQAGAAFELAAAQLRWLASHGYANLESAIEAFEIISVDNKAFILKGARAVNNKRAVDLPATFDRMEAAWEQGMQALRTAVRG